MTVPVPTTQLSFFQLFVTYKLLEFLMEETNDYANYLRKEMTARGAAYKWCGCSVDDIAKFLGICMWMGIIVVPEFKMFWA